MGEDDIRCPICSLNLQILSQRKREEHCDECLERIECGNTETDLLPTKKDCDIVTTEYSTSQLQIQNKPNTNVQTVEVKRETFSAFFDLGKRKRTEEIGSAAPVAPSGNKGTKKTTTSPATRKPPFYKTIELGGTKIAVDAFSFGALPGVTSYFLSHFHSDHYIGLNKSWNHGLIYCSEATARLVAYKLRVDSSLLRPLAMNTTHTIEGISVNLLDANHCPGAVVFLFNNHTLHTGDFRASLELIDELRIFTSSLKSLYLDTTYLDPDRRFPSQDLVVNTCADYCLKFQSKPMASGFFDRTPRPRRIVVLCGTYTIGKERLALKIAHHLNNRIWAPPWKRKIIELIGDETLLKPFSGDESECQVHLVSMSELSMPKLEARWKQLSKHFTHLVAFQPTGWTWQRGNALFTLNSLESSKTTTVSHGGLIRLCRVPYSEHSSYSELEMFCGSIQCHNIIATVHTKRYDILRNWEK